MNKQQLLNKWIAALALSGFLIPATAFAEDSDPAREAILASESGDLATAKSKIEEKIAKNPGDESAKALLAEINARIASGISPAAQKQFEDAASANLNLFRAVEGAMLDASTLAAKGNPKEAVNILDQAAAALPQNAAAQALKERVLSLKQRILFASEARTEGNESIVVETTLANAIERNKAAISKARRLIDLADDQISAGRLAEASGSLDKAGQLLPQGEVAATAKQELIETRSRLIKALYVDALEKIDLPAAGEQVAAFEALHGATTRASMEFRADYEKQLIDPHKKSVADISPQYVANEKKANELLGKAKALYLFGNYQGALNIYKEVLQSLPNNAQAKAMSIRIRRELSDKSGEYNREFAREAAVEVVNQSWMPASNYDRVIQATNTRTDEESPVVKRMKSIKIPSVTLHAVPLELAIETLGELSRAYDTTGKGVNFNIIDPGRTGTGQTVTLTMHAVTLDLVLEQVLRAVNYSYNVGPGEVLEIRPGGVIGDVETRFFSVTPVLVTTLVGVTPAKTNDAFGGGGAGAGGDDPNEKLKAYFERLGIKFKPEEGTGISFDGQTNLIVTASPRTLDRIATILKRYSDVKQVHIEAKFIDISQGALDQVAANWTLTNTVTRNGIETTQTSAATGNRTLRSAFVTSSGGTNGLVASPDTPGITANDNNGNNIIVPPSQGLNVPIINNPPAFLSGPRFDGANKVSAFDGLNGGDSPSFAGTFYTTMGIGGYEAGLYIQALSNATGSDLMAAPSVTTTSGQTATIKIVQLLRYPESYSQIQSTVSAGGGNFGLTGGGGSSSASVAITAGSPQDFTTQEVGVSLEVTPTVGADNVSIEMEMKPKVIEFEGFVEYGGTSVAIAGSTVVTVPSGFYQPVFNTRSVETKVTVYDGSTIIIGGLTREEVKTIHDKVPVLGDLPLVGHLFQSNAKTSAKRNLMIFVTANLISPGGSMQKNSIGGVSAGSSLANPTVQFPSGPEYRTPSEAAGARAQ